ncbi:hypothetical protein BU17DRAFT_65121 [Hysterangium stoloniferum]|nr:hypothetical protein BU17DRAFT_65121 [Hysterangium stoloniferum]
MCQARSEAPKPSKPGPLDGSVRAESPACVPAKPEPQAQATALGRLWDGFATVTCTELYCLVFKLANLPSHMEFFPAMMTSSGNARPRHKAVPSARVIDPLNDGGEKQVTSHRNAFALARQQEEEVAKKQWEKSASGPTPVSTASSPQSLPDPTPTGSKHSSAQASINSIESGDPKRIRRSASVEVRNWGTEGDDHAGGDDDVEIQPIDPQTLQSCLTGTTHSGFGMFFLHTFQATMIEWLVSTDQPIQALEHPAFQNMMNIAACAKDGVKIPNHKQT